MDTEWSVSHIESKQELDYHTNIDKAVDRYPSLVWGIGFPMADAVYKATEENPEVRVVDIECSNGVGAGNLACVNFESEEPRSPSAISQRACPRRARSALRGRRERHHGCAYRRGYFADGAYANKQQGTSVKYAWRIAESFADVAKGKSIVQKMITHMGMCWFRTPFAP